MTSSLAEGQVRGMLSRRNSARDAEIIAAYADGERHRSMESVGGSFGISRQRVQQIVWRWEAETGETLIRRIQHRKQQALSLTTTSVNPSLAQRLLSLARLQPETGCWLWTGRCYRLSPGREYPVVSIRGKSHYARRLAYTLWRLAIVPVDRVVVPLVCRRMDCINPFHLEAVSRREASHAFPRLPQRPRPPRTHCRRGHEFTADNTYWNPATKEERGVRVKGYTRLCRLCCRERGNAYRKKSVPAEQDP